MACHLKCPFCPQSPSVGYFYKHLFQQHITTLFDETTDWGKNNLRWLNAGKVRSSPYTLYLPKNETKYCCPKCSVAVNKEYYIQKHTKCLKECVDTCEEYKILLNITPALAPFTDKPVEEEKAGGVSNGMAEWREKVYQKIIFNLTSEVADKQEWAFWFNKLLEDDSIHAKYKELSEDTSMPEDEKFNLDVECRAEMKLLGLTDKNIREVGRKKIPIRPD